MARTITKTIPITEKEWTGTLTLTAKKALLRGYKIKKLQLEIYNNQGSIEYEITPTPLCELKKKIDITTPRLDPTTLTPYETQTIITQAQIDSNGKIESCKIKNLPGEETTINILAERHNQEWRLTGEITYEWTKSGIPRHALGVITQETGIKIESYIKQALDNP